MIIKRCDKHGETQAWIIGIILAIVIGGLILFFASNAFSKVEGVINKADLDIGLISQKCDIQIDISKGEAYCAEKIPIGESNNYITCPYAKKKFGVTTERDMPECDIDEGAKAVCRKLLAEDSTIKPEKIYVNEKPCYKAGGTIGKDHWGINRGSFCDGNAIACDKLSLSNDPQKAKNECESQKGCEYKESKCIGTVTACITFDESPECESQKGCSWIEV